MSTAQDIASPPASRGKQQPPPRSANQGPQNNSGRGSQRRPRGNRAPNSHNQLNAVASPSRSPRNARPALAESAIFSSEDLTGPRNAKKHAQSQPGGDRLFSPNGAQSSLLSSDAARNSVSATPSKNQGAYAGPTFHASPAPSALPIPKFLSRSVPAKIQPGPPTPPLEESSDSANSPSPSPSPSRAPISVPARHEDSPLDMLFKADKAERARNVTGSPVSTLYPNSNRPQHHKQDSYGSLNAIFPLELDGGTKHTHLSPPPFASPVAHRSVTDPSKVPQLKDASQAYDGKDIMQDLFNRLSMSQKKPATTTPPRADQASSDPQGHQQTLSPSESHSASGPSTPVAPPVQESSDLFYGNRNLSPMFKAAKGDSAKRNSGLRTEVTADSPTVSQSAFQDFPSIPSAKQMDPHAFSRGYPNSGPQVPAGPRRGSAPYVQPYREMPNNRQTKTPGRYPYQPRADHYPHARNNASGFSPGQGQQTSTPVTASPRKPSTSMMSFVPASVAAKQHKASAPPTAAASANLPQSPPMKTSTPDTLALEQDLKRLLNLNIAGDISSVR
ncbi:hypothetical protein P153DRAFT_386700 [Dothidotthia symphoricarpi CBS 119687]|uniref:Proteophosphoglycan 5 n=1 Tax=Dothidotthia symphoricarpi CBS 119687 TaxID=1392245 RepID=A0A6A6ABJ4_9PLEO|nr:uncharacterized protein P153DRAFT_386700 [Dothidotthia symphoricarpi CBS 119687]KAF2128583.1 hypothetical protein P153DRAFT_386700 [Dothidotthia symphoricarpi CBS 119687]